MSSDNPKPKQAFWNEHSEAWQSSGLSQRAYCSQQGINYRSFIGHRNRTARKVRQAAMSFIEAKSESVATSQQTVGLQLMLPNGIRVGISNEVNPTLLKTVLAIAGGLSC
ncbi:MAG: hypothetical protein EBY22_04340 [Gammaproteobacteria bacterium]|nr:hypothetical protein [Gammaproteobacteria bacterium]